MKKIYLLISMLMSAPLMYTASKERKLELQEQEEKEQKEGKAYESHIQEGTIREAQNQEEINGDFITTVVREARRESDGHRPDLSAIKAILREGADINALDRLKETALMFAVQENASQLFQFLIAHSGVDLLAKNIQNNTILMMFNIHTKQSIIDGVFAHPAITKLVNMQNSDGCTALVIHTIKNNLEMVKKLLRVPMVNPNLQNNSGETALHIAADRNMPEIIRALLTLHATDPLVTNNWGNTALDVAIMSYRPRCVQELLKASYPVPMLKQALYGAQRLEPRTAAEHNKKRAMIPMLEGALARRQVELKQGGELKRHEARMKKNNN